MSFLKRFFKKKEKKGSIVFDLKAQEVGEISNIRYDGDTKIQVYEISTKDTKMKLSFPPDQFFTDDTGRIFLLPEWCYHVRASCSKLLDLKKEYGEINNFRGALKPTAYLGHLKEILKNSIPCGEEIIQHLTKFEDLLIELGKEKTKITDETSRLMTLRLLEFGGETRKNTSAHLARKQYSLKIIDLRTRYRNVSRLVQFVNTLYENTKTSLTFLEELLERFDMQKEVYPTDTQELESLMKRAVHVRNRQNEVIGILESLIESLTT